MSKRDDAYHDISSIMLPIDLFDRMEISKSDAFGVDYSGLNFDTSQELVGQLINWLEGEYCTEPFHVHLHKEIPIGCGFGGGSSDLAFFV